MTYIRVLSISYLIEDLEKRSICVKRDPEKGPICVKRDLEKRPIYVPLSFWHTPARYEMCQKRPVPLKRDLQKSRNIETRYDFKKAHICAV